MYKRQQLEIAGHLVVFLVDLVQFLLKGVLLLLRFLLDLLDLLFQPFALRLAGLLVQAFLFLFFQAGQLLLVLLALVVVLFIGEL